MTFDQIIYRATQAENRGNERLAEVYYNILAKMESGDYDPILDYDTILDDIYAVTQ